MIPVMQKTSLCVTAAWMRQRAFGVVPVFVPISGCEAVFNGSSFRFPNVFTISWNSDCRRRYDPPASTIFRLDSKGLTRTPFSVYPSFWFGTLASAPNILLRRSCSPSLL